VRPRPLLRTRFLVLAFTVLGTYFVCPFRLGVVWGHSMDPTFHHGEICLLDRAYYRRNPMRKGEVIVFRHAGETLTKRVYGAPGDTLTLLWYPDDGSYDIPATMSPRRLQAFTRHHIFSRLIYLTVPSDKCFVLGDNPSVSCDSREFGLVDRSAVIGKMVSAL
jgi:signal peptidase I